MNKKILSLCVLLMACLSVAAQTPSQILAKTATQLKNGKGIECLFKVSSGKQSFHGTLKSSGQKFSVITPVSSTWYNGKDMYIYNSSSKETTVMKPTPAELAESNPMMYLNNYTNGFTCSMAKTQVKGQHNVVLTPKKRNSGINSVTVSVDSKTYKPLQFKITSSDRNVTTIDIVKLQTGLSLSGSSFDYPAKSYPGVEVVDLR